MKNKLKVLMIGPLHAPVGGTGVLFEALLGVLDALSLPFNSIRKRITAFDRVPVA